jgi:hypothetical protein
LVEVEQVEQLKIILVQMEIHLYFQQLHLQVEEVDQVIVILHHYFQGDLEDRVVELWNLVQQVKEIHPQQVRLKEIMEEQQLQDLVLVQEEVVLVVWEEMVAQTERQEDQEEQVQQTVLQDHRLQELVEEVEEFHLLQHHLELQDQEDQVLVELEVKEV